jgi:hypothetical protein
MMEETVHATLVSKEDINVNIPSQLLPRQNETILNRRVNQKKNLIRRRREQKSWTIYLAATARDQQPMRQRFLHIPS